MLWVAAMHNVVLSLADMVCLACMQKLWSACAVMGLFDMFEFKYCCEILLLMVI